MKDDPVEDEYSPEPGWVPADFDVRDRVKHARLDDQLLRRVRVPTRGVALKRFEARAGDRDGAREIDYTPLWVALIVRTTTTTAQKIDAVLRSVLQANNRTRLKVETMLLVLDSAAARAEYVESLVEGLAGAQLGHTVVCRRCRFTTTDAQAYRTHACKGRKR